ncbi:MAG: hypothetical protein AAB378_00240 [Patescibacteria group bacterium]
MKTYEIKRIRSIGAHGIAECRGNAVVVAVGVDMRNSGKTKQRYAAENNY